MKGIFKNSSLGAQILQFVLVLLFFITLTGVVVAALLTIGLNELWTLRLLLFAQFLFIFLLFSFTMAFLWGDHPLHDLGLKQKTNPRTFLFLFLYIIAIIPFINLLGELNAGIVLPDFLSEIEKQLKEWEAKTAEQIEILLSAHSIKGYFLNLILIAVFPAIGEELLFRGTMQRLFQKWKGAIWAVWITAFCFSAIHFQFYGFIPRLLLGAVLGYLLVWSKNLYLPMFAHFVNNGIAVSFYYLQKNDCSFVDIDTIGTGTSLWIGCLSGLVAVIGLYFLRKEIISQQKKNDKLSPQANPV